MTTSYEIKINQARKMRGKHHKKTILQTHN